MNSIENSEILINVLEKGSEIASIFDKKQNRQYLWQGLEEWPKHGPVLFPTIGGFQNSKYLVNGKEYTMGAHGFARDMFFELEEKTDDKIVMVLKSNEETKKNYPFDFILKITHRLEGRSLYINWSVKNEGKDPMYFSIGGHPGFQFAEGTKLTDYELRFDKDVSISSRKVKGRLVTSEKFKIAEKTNCLPLTKKLLEEDAIILEENICTATLVNEAADYFLKMDLTGFPIVAFWTRPDYVDNARYLCMEPWFGLNDTVEQPVMELSKKYRIQTIKPNDIWENEYSITIGSKN